MRILVIGASGRTGKLVVNEALERGHKVTALVRNPASLAARDSLQIVRGTPMNKQDIENALLDTNNDPPQAVIVTLNAPRESDNPFAKSISPARLMADSVANVRELMQSQGIKKLVIMSAFGVGDSFQNLNFLMKLVISYTNMSAQYHDHNLVDEETRDSQLDWVLVRPVMLKGEEALPVKELGNTGKGASFMPSISRASVAKFLVNAVESNKWNRKSSVICN